MFIRRLIKVVLTLSSLMAPPLMLSAHAQPRGDWDPTDLELLRLPQYCIGQFRKEHWNKPGYRIVGCGTFINHFCPALVGLMRAENVLAPKKERRHYFNTSGNHLAYTRKNMPQNCSVANDIAAAELRHRLLSISLK